MILTTRPVTGVKTWAERMSSRVTRPLVRMVSSTSCSAMVWTSIFASFTCCGVSQTWPGGGCGPGGSDAASDL